VPDSRVLVLGALREIGLAIRDVRRHERSGDAESVGRAYWAVLREHRAVHAQFGARAAWSQDPLGQGRVAHGTVRRRTTLPVMKPGAVRLQGRAHHGDRKGRLLENTEMTTVLRRTPL
jgi:hypothetical protein